MKLIIAGSSRIAPKEAYRHVCRALTEIFLGKTPIPNAPLEEIVSGTAAGVDTAGEDWAAEHHIPVKRFPANWRERGRAAGPIRNREMARYADAALIVWDGTSPGSCNMKAEIEKLGKPVFVYLIES